MKPQPYFKQALKLRDINFIDEADNNKHIEISLY